MINLPSKVVDLQRSYRSAVRQVGNNTEEYKKHLRDIVPLPVESFVYGDVFSSISYYLCVPDRRMFNYEDWAKYLSEILEESERVHMRRGTDESRLKSLVLTVNDLKQGGQEHPRFQEIWRRREEILNDFLASPYLLNEVMLRKDLDIPSVWKNWSVKKDVVFLEPIIECCVEEIQADEKIIPKVKEVLCFGGVMKEWKSLLRDDKFVELYEFVLEKVKAISDGH